MHKQFEEEEQEGLMKQFPRRDALDDYCESLTIAATGAIEKKGRTDEVRVIFDGSNRIPLNPGIRVRDQVRFSTAADSRAVLEECAKEKGLDYSLRYHVSKVHRRIPVLRSEWGRQACLMIGTAALVQQEHLRKEAKRDRKVFETHGQQREGHPHLRPGLEDFPDHVLDQTMCSTRWSGSTAWAPLELGQQDIGGVEQVQASFDSRITSSGPSMRCGRCFTRMMDG